MTSYTGILVKLDRFRALGESGRVPLTVQQCGYLSSPNTESPWCGSTRGLSPFYRRLSKRPGDIAGYVSITDAERVFLFFFSSSSFHAFSVQFPRSGADSFGIVRAGRFVPLFFFCFSLFHSGNRFNQRIARNLERSLDTRESPRHARPLSRGTFSRVASPTAEMVLLNDRVDMKRSKVSFLPRYGALDRSFVSKRKESSKFASFAPSVSYDSVIFSFDRIEHVQRRIYNLYWRI